MYFAGIEAGGTKIICSIGDDKFNIIERVAIKTTNPQETMVQIIEFFNRYQGKISAFGIGSFGLIDINRDSKYYGYITNTPKVLWQYYDFVGNIKNAFDVPICWTTDVNAAAYGEYRQGAATKNNSVVYVTVGTGIGAGAIQNDDFIGGMMHSEMGHMMVRRHPEDTFGGECAFHHDCLEGLAAGPSIKSRAGIEGNELKVDDDIWEYIAYYLAQFIYNVTLTLAPEKIIMGGGVMKQTLLFNKIAHHFESITNGYVSTPELSTYLVPPALGDNSATIGCLALAKLEYGKKLSE